MGTENLELTVTGEANRKAKVSPYFSLGDPTGEVNARRRKIVVSEVVRSNAQTNPTIHITIADQRRRVPSDDWTVTSVFDRREVRAGEEIRLKLTAKETESLFRGLEELYEVAKYGVPWGDREIVVLDLNDKSTARSEIFRQMLSREPSVWDALEELIPSMPVASALMRVQALYQEQLGIFETRLQSADWLERDWEEFFDRNPWIFGYGLDYRILGIIDRQSYGGGTSFTGKGARRSDFMTASAGDVRFTVPVEIKTPEAKLVKPKRYRTGAFVAGDEVVGGTAQLLEFCHRWEHHTKTEEETRDVLESDDVYTRAPKGILVVGHLKQVGTDRRMRESFEAFRQNLNNPRILTFDELFERAKFIVDNHKSFEAKAKDS